MKQNNRKKTWKAIVAVVLVMTSLFAISTAVSAEFVDTVFEEVYDLMTTSSNNSAHTHTDACYEEVPVYCTIAMWIGNEPICSSGNHCPGGKHQEGIWHRLVCGYTGDM